MKKLRVVNFDLTRTLECGQFFRYEKVGEFYFVTHGNYLFKIRQDNKTLYYQGVSKDFLKRFFRLGDPYCRILNSTSNDNFIKRVIKINHGLRVIRQDPWVCLVSYLCSSNSNIPKITKNLNLIAKNFGKRIKLDSYENYSFPKPGEIDCKKTLRICRVGYRADFIYRVNKEVSYKELLRLRKRSYEEAKDFLIGIHGVGEKIADCVCLFSLDKLEAFPVDVWIKRAMEEHYFKAQSVSKSEIRGFARDYFGKYAGYANQFLFYYRRSQR